MDSKEQIYNTAEEPAALPDRLKDVLAEAYPDPKGKIAASVMAQIRLEREAEEKRVRAARADARRRRQGIFMKWGDMAACMMILCGALVIAAPLMNRSADMAAEDAAAEQVNLLADVVADVEAYSDDAAPAEYGTFTYTAEGEVTEEAAMTKSAPLKQAAQAETEAEENGEASANQVMYAVRSTAAFDAAVEKGTETAEEKEAFLQELFDEGKLTEEQYGQWMTFMGYTGVDDWTIGELCAFIGIAAE